MHRSGINFALAHWRQMLLALLGSLGLCSLAGAVEPVSPEGAIDPRSFPLWLNETIPAPTFAVAAPTRPVAVTVSLAVLELGWSPIRADAYRVSGTITSTWKPEELPANPSVPAHGEVPLVGPSLWVPPLRVVNALAPVQYQEPRLALTSEGMIVARVLFTAEAVAAHLRFLQYPFDEQRLDLAVGPAALSTVPIVFSSTPGITPTTAAPSGWVVDSVQVQPPHGLSVGPDAAPYALQVFTIVLERAWGYPLSDTIIPLLLVTCLAIASIYIPRPFFASAIVLCGVALIVVTLLKSAIANAVPHNGGLTFCGALILLSFLTITAVSVLHIYVYRRHRRTRDEQDESAAKLWRTVVPAAYAALVLVTVAIYFGW